MSLTQEAIVQQQNLLHQHRRRLAVLLQQQARLGDYAPAHIHLEIEDTQAAIRDFKKTLSTAGIAVEDEPNDDARPIVVVLPSHLSPQERRNRRRMLQKVRDFWVQGVLEKSLYNEVLIDLGMETRPDAVAYPWDMLVQQPGREARPFPPTTKIIDVYDQMDGELLILGAPGSGKTTILLELARDLIARAEQDEGLPLPVVFNLSSWAEKCAPLADWLVDELNIRYDAPRKIGKAWVDTDAVLLLLDGLDEVQQDQRAACVEAINTFRQAHGLVCVVVCSRIADYDALTTRLRLQGAVLAQPLTTQQVDTYLEKVGDQLAALRAALTDDAMLRELTESPLMLSVIVLVYRGRGVGTLTHGGTIEEHRKQLFDMYVERMFVRRGAAPYYRRKQTIEWLSWLAQGMVQKSQSVFFIEQLQPDHLMTSATHAQYALLDRMGSGLIFGLISGLVNGLVGGLAAGLGDGVGLGLISGLFGGRNYAAFNGQRTFWVQLCDANSAMLVVGLVDGMACGILIEVLGISDGLPFVGLRLGWLNGVQYGLAAFIIGAMLGVLPLSIVDNSPSRMLTT